VSAPYHAKYLAHELTKRVSADSAEKLPKSLCNATVDMESIVDNAKGQALLFHGIPPHAGVSPDPARSEEPNGTGGGVGGDFINLQFLPVIHQSFLFLTSVFLDATSPRDSASFSTFSHGTFENDESSPFFLVGLIQHTNWIRPAI
jgi:hypothetical protein